MFKLSLKCEVIPSILFQGEVECLEHLPRYGGSFGDVFHGMLAGRQVALKRLRLFQLTDKETYWKVSQVNPMKMKSYLSNYVRTCVGRHCCGDNFTTLLFCLFLGSAATPLMGRFT